MRSTGVPRMASPVPRRFPAPAGKQDSAYDADNGAGSPGSPQIGDDTYTYREEPVGSIERSGKHIPRGEPSRVYLRTSGESGEPEAEHGSEATNQLPAPPGNPRGRRGSPPEPWQRWFCPVWFDGLTLRAPGGDDGDDDVAEASAQPTTLPADRADWPEEALENWEERSAIIEFDGGLPREEAERLAEERVRLECARSRVVPGGGPS